MTLASLLAVCACALPQDAAPPLLPHAALIEKMRALERDHRELATVLAVGRSRGGREILALRISAGEPPHGRPAILVVANIDGPQVFSSGVALWQAEELLRTSADERTKSLLDATTLYVIPRANPDAAEARFETPLAEREASGAGVDNDRDGRFGEDPPADVDGDGRLLQMRVPDPEGRWLEDPRDPRALVEADAAKGERGRWKLWPEGRDLDRDEKVAEDAPLDAFVNRNFAQDWQQHDASAGVFPTDEPETRALAEFLLLHRDIALVVTYGAQDNLVEKPSSVKRDAPAVKLIPPSGVLEPDAQLLAELGKRYRETTEQKTKGRGKADGSFQSWSYQQRGLWSLAISLWDIPIEAKAAEKKHDGAPKPAGETKTADESKPEVAAAAPGAEPAAADESGAKKEKKEEREPSDDAKRIAWLDEHGEGARFVPWKSFEHPELGAVEVGGLAPYARIEPPAADAPAIARKELEFLTSLGATLARVELTDCTAKDLGGGVLEVKAALENRSLLPLQSAAGARAETIRPAKLTLLVPDGATLLAGAKQTLVRELAGSGGRVEFRWLVQGAQASALGIEVDTDHAGTARARPEVK